MLQQKVTRPLLIYDADCTFCRRWVARWRARTGDRLQYEPFQKPGILDKYQIPKVLAERAVQLIDPTGQRYEGADAVFRALARAPEMRIVSFLGRLPLIRTLAGWFYRKIARHRKASAWIDHLLWGKSVKPPTTLWIRWFFFRGLAIIYFIAFRSLRVQLLGLYGKEGILPIDDFLKRVREQIPDSSRYHLAPSFLWLDSSDAALVRLCRSGEVASLVLFLGIAPRITVAVLWSLYLSFVSVGREFLSYQWDALLLEAGLHAAIIAPPGIKPGLGSQRPSWISVLLMRWLIFKLHFESGLSKIQSHDPTWRGLTACSYHYETQPLPTPIGWYAHHLPQPIQKLSTQMALAIECGVPFLSFAPRQLRRASFLMLSGFQTMIAMTGNYGFFNLLSLVLGMWALDDESIPYLWKRWLARPTSLGQPASTGHKITQALIAAPLATLSVSDLLGRLRKQPLGLQPIRRLDNFLRPFQVINSYGLFAVMTTTRPEVIIEGSKDGETWIEYEFRYKIGNVLKAPPWVAPHQPRLDWQFWFAALRPPEIWLETLILRLLQGSSEVLALLKVNPFPDHPPRFIRASYYLYQMTDLETKRNTGAWWKRERLGLYFPPASLRKAA